MKPNPGLVLAALLFSFLLAGAAALPASASDPLAPGEIKVWITLRDKGPSTAGLTSGSRASRAYEDKAVFEPYVQALGVLGLTCDTRLKWQNRVSGRIAAGSLDRLRSLPFVAEVSLMPRKARPAPLPQGPFPWTPDALAKRAAEGLEYGAGRPLMESLHVDKLHAWMTATGLGAGKGVRIAVIDADFHLGSPIFDDMKTRIKDQYDFVEGKDAAVTSEFQSSHGAQCMSTIGGNLPGTLVGVAPEADFLLYRAEDNVRERYVEEDFVAAAIERAVDSGAQVISISLGYRYEYDAEPDLAFSQFDGRTRPSSIAALGAARRNVVVSVSVGNLPLPSHIPATGGTLSAPADADSILAVGIVDRSRNKCSYSCTGPTADGRIKPEVASMGIGAGCVVAVAATGSRIAGVDQFAGTSFAAPVISGIAALLRQLRPKASAETIRQALMRTAHRAESPDILVGYGLVDAVEAAQRIGVPLIPPLAEHRVTRHYHSGGSGPILMEWLPGTSQPELELVDVTGRRIPITVRSLGAQLLVKPNHPLQTGVYIARIP
ncbi:MAG: S8 family serine peptidase [Fibrobacterota bacterium]|nr:S8 family serine peptidase [Fibrobacterota bacterium]